VNYFVLFNIAVKGNAVLLYGICTTLALNSMSRTKFRLSNRNQQATSSGITLDYSNSQFKHNRFKWGTGITVLVKYWDESTQRLKPKGTYIDEATKINRKLHNIQNALIDYVDGNKLLDKDELKQALQKASGAAAVINHVDIVKQASFSELAINHIELNREGLKPSSVKVKLSRINTIKNNFAPIRIDKFDVATFDALMDKLKSIKLKDGTPKYKSNHLANLAMEIRTQLRYFDVILELKVHKDYTKKLFNIRLNDVDTIALTEQHLVAFRTVELGPEANAVRESFLMSCYTGLRWSDVIKFNPDEHQKTINDFDVISIKQTKTGGEVVIPISARCQPYVKAHKHNQYAVVKHLKNIAKLAGVDEWELVTFHTARRTFATNAVRAGVPLFEVQKLTGHKSEASFLKYIKMSPAEVSFRLASHPHFQ